MSERGVALFVHLLGVVTLFIAIGVAQLSGARIRAASTVEEVRLWLGLAEKTGPMWATSFGLILLSGLFMAGRMWTFGTPWIVVALCTIAVMGTLGGVVVGRGFTAMGRAATSSGPVPPELARLVAAPAPRIASGALAGLAVGVLWLMANKPGWTGSIVVVAGLGVAGAVAALASLHRSQPASTPSRMGRTGA